MRKVAIEYRELKRLASELQDEVILSDVERLRMTQANVKLEVKGSLPVVDVSKGTGLLNEVKPVNKEERNRPREEIKERKVAIRGERGRDVEAKSR
ncbi:hypothetical protein Sjap_012509 [Stephania japonica]|uniref:Uncharacterized protein n=1 Tax=Stephania japonica TaxID=461633 RepID=A0AAP0IW23_9MAGN